MTLAVPMLRLGEKCPLLPAQWVTHKVFPLLGTCSCHGCSCPFGQCKDGLATDGCLRSKGCSGCCTSAPLGMLRRRCSVPLSTAVIQGRAKGRHSQAMDPLWGQQQHISYIGSAADLLVAQLMGIVCQAGPRTIRAAPSALVHSAARFTLLQSAKPSSWP
jgi:hypothetical protein